MPLHLLGKKSWNVYNADNVARVRRDEAAAKAAEEAEEQRMQEVDAQRRLALLRGETPPPLTDEKEETTENIERAPRRAQDGYPGSSRRKRKRAGEDDTEFELRVAKENRLRITGGARDSAKTASSAPIVDHAGHIDLLGDERLRAHAEKNEEAEKEKKEKEKEYEDQYTMRFSNAAGREGINKPWYSLADTAAVETPAKDAFGRDDPRRKERDAHRMIANDPLAIMKKGASQIRELKQERKRFREEQEAQVRLLRKDEQRREKHAKRREGRGSRDRSRQERSERKRSRSREREHDNTERQDRRERSHRDDDRRHRHRHRARSRSHSHDDRLQRHTNNERRAK